jgi:hypothetical protein
VADSGSWAGLRLDDLGGTRVGRIEEVLTGEGAEPEWLLARMGRFGHRTLIPARDAVEGVGTVWVPYTRDQIRHAPKVEPGVAPTDELAAGLHRHYGIAPAD